MTFPVRVVLAAIVVGSTATAVYVFALPRTDESTATLVSPSGDVAVVMPFEVAVGEPGLADLRDAIHERLTTIFSGEGVPLAVAASVVRHAMRSDAEESGHGIAARSGASLLITGRIGGGRGRLSIAADIVALPTGTVRVRAQVGGAADSLPHLVDRLATRLLATHAARDEAELSALSSTSLPALQAYLAGQESRRRGASAETTEQYLERALAIDPNFALAALALAASANLHGTRGVDEYWKLDAAWKGRVLLDAADRGVLAAYLGTDHPRPPTLHERIELGAAAARNAPQRWEAWFVFGENLRRYGSLVGYPEWDVEATAAFQRALALDSTDATTLDRLFLLAGAAEDQDATRRYADQYLKHNALGASAEFVRWRRAVAVGDDSALVAIRDRFPAMTAITLQRIVLWSSEHGVGVGDGHRAADALLRRAVSTSERRVAFNRMVSVLLNRGLPGEAARLLAEPETGFGARQGMGTIEFPIYAALYWDGDTAAAIAAVRHLEALVDRAHTPLSHAAEGGVGACALAQWYLATGELTLALAARARLLHAATSPDPIDAQGAAVCAAIVHAQLAARQGGSPASLTRAAEHLDSLLRHASNSRDLRYVVGNLAAARTFEALGDTPRALAIVRRRAGWNAFLATQLREEGRLAALAGDRRGAIRAYRQFLAHRAAPAAHLRADVDRVRLELDRLERNAEQHDALGVPLRR